MCVYVLFYISPICPPHSPLPVPQPPVLLLKIK